MGGLLRTSLLLYIGTALASADTACISAVSWGDPRVDLFGLAPDKSIWHKFYTGYDWQPEQFERVPSETIDCPSVSSWGYGRLDLVWTSQSDGAVLHKWFGRGSWGPSWENANNLGGSGDVESVETLSWEENRLDIVGNAPNGSVLHKAWTGTDYFPSGSKWENLGGNITGLPSIGSWGKNRLDIVGISAETGSLVHKYWEASAWSDWEDLEGGPFVGKPTVTSWGAERLDLWAVDEDGMLKHKFWDGFMWNGWEKLGGKFTQTPQVVHWAQGKIDIVGKNADDNKYYLKSYDGQKWNPSVAGWYDLSGPYVSEPKLLTKDNGQNFLYLFGIDAQSDLRMQIWSGYEWQPSAKETWPLGNVSKPYPEKSDTLLHGNQQVLLGAEL
ncbi:hypothetical protein F5Y01DRAFT_296033 [Xylaria sp. FL0043]|nr:hypothetical protein F5Y01DRAFT_296033 [Xylaria sp. FL0043]